MNFQFIVNPSAGHGNYKLIIHDIQKMLSGCDLHYDIAIPSYKGEATSIAKETAENHDVVVAVGGDGTVNEIINGLMGANAILGIIPAGTGNGFAREFGIPLNVKQACKVLLDNHTKWIDVGKADERYFLGFAGMGFDALIAKFAGEMLGPLRGMWIYFIAGVLVFYKYKPDVINIKIDSQEVNVRPLLIAIANTKRYGGRALIAPQATPEDGLFDVCVISLMKDRHLLRHLPKLFKGKHTNLEYVKIYRGSNVSIKSPSPIPIHVDGESIEGCCEMQFKIIPKAVRILVPKEGESD